MEKAKSKVIKDREDAKKRAASKSLQEVRAILQFDKIKFRKKTYEELNPFGEFIKKLYSS